MSGLDGLGWPTDPQPLPSRRYTCQVCGRKGRRGNSISERNRPPICPACTRNRSALCALCTYARAYRRPPVEEDAFRFGVGEGSHIDRVPLPEKVRNQTTVSDYLQDSNDCLRLGGRGLRVKLLTLKTFINATYMHFRGTITLFSTSKFK
jgi:hypothetical protein